MWKGILCQNNSDSRYPSYISQKFFQPEENEMAECRHDIGKECTTGGPHQSHQLAKVWHLDGGNDGEDGDDGDDDWEC